MSLTETTLAAACAATDKTIVLASATGVTVGTRFRIDDENFVATKAYTSGSVTVPIVRARGGGVPTLHPITSAVTYGLASDEGWGGIAGQTDVQYPFIKAQRQLGYSADGAITLPDPGSDMTAVLNAVSTTVLAMTIADPTRAMDGCKLRILSRNGTGAHTLTFAGGLNGAGSSYNVFTFPAGPVMIEVVAWDLFWYVPVAPAITGTVTLLTGGIA